MNTQWQEFYETLRQSGDELLLAAPDEQTRGEGVAYLARLTAYGIERYLMGAERLTNGIAFNTPRIGGYNPDYRIGAANLQPGRHYRISGRIDQAYRIGLGVYSLAPDGGRRPVLDRATRIRPQSARTPFHSSLQARGDGRKKQLVGTIDDFIQ